MSTLRGFLPQQDSSYSGKIESIPEKTAFDSVFRILLPTQKTTYSGKTENVIIEPDITFFKNILSNIFEDINSEVLNSDECC